MLSGSKVKPYPGLELTAHIGEFGDMKDAAASILTDKIPPHFIQGFDLSFADADLNRCLEYRALLSSGRWTNWASCTNYVGTRGESLALREFSLRLRKNFKQLFNLSFVGAFMAEDGVVVAEDGMDCISGDGENALVGMQIFLQAKK